MCKGVKINYYILFNKINNKHKFYLLILNKLSIKNYLLFNRVILF